MGLPHFEKCCCFDLKTGNMILGSINAFFSFVLFAAMVVAATEFGTMERDAAKDMEVFHNVDTIEADATINGIYAMAIILVFMFLAKFIFDIFFLYGVVMERPGIIKAYFIMWTVFTLLSMFTFFLNVYHFATMTIITELIYIGLNVYCMLVCHSFYVQLNSREEV